MSDLNEGHLALALIADALFCSKLKTGDLPTAPDLVAAIRDSLMGHRGWDKRTRAVAAAFAKAPAWAAEREVWCQQLAKRALSSVELSAALEGLL